MKKGIEKMMEILQKAFEIEEIKTESYKEGFFGGKITKFYIPEQNIMRILNDFPCLESAVKAGLLVKDKRKKSYYTTSKILSVKSTDKRKMGEKQFFSFDGVDTNDRTTLKDILVSIDNVKKLAVKMNIDPKEVKFSIRYKNGNPDEVVNFMKVKPELFGKDKDEVQRNLKKINNVVKFKR